MTECRTDGTSAFNTRTVQRRLLLLDPARGKERLMEIQQHDGVVVEVAGFQQGFAKDCERERGVAGEEGGAQGCRLLPSLPPLFIGPLGAPALGRSDLQGGRRPSGGKGVPCPPRQGRSSPLGFPTLGAWGEAQGGRPSPLRAGSLPLSPHGALRDRWPHPVDPRDPSGGPGTIPVTPETFPVAET